MKDKSFVIKVGDLLQSGGKEDTIEFEGRTISELVGLDKQGISGIVVLRSINQDSLYVSLENISCVLDETCDRCGVGYKRIVETPEYISRFVISEERKNEEQETSDEEIFVINARDETIDIQPMLIQSIKLQDPIIKHCPICEKEIANQPNEDDSDESSIGQGNVIFH